MIHLLPTLCAVGPTGDYIDPPTGENLGNLSDINNPRNLEFFWNFESDQYERKEGLGETINFGGDPIPLATDIRAVLPSGFFTDYEPSIEPTTQAPTSATFEGYHHVIAADVRRGDLFSHPRRNGKFFPVNSRAEGQDDNGPFIRLEYIDIYESDQPIEWIPTGAGPEHHHSGGLRLHTKRRARLHYAGRDRMGPHQEPPNRGREGREAGGSPHGRDPAALPMVLRPRRLHLQPPGSDER